jgi:hypothetical protein
MIENNIVQQNGNKQLWIKQMDQTQKQTTVQILVEVLLHHHLIPAQILVLMKENNRPLNT